MAEAHMTAQHVTLWILHMMLWILEPCGIYIITNTKSAYFVLDAYCCYNNSAGAAIYTVASLEHSSKELTRYYTFIVQHTLFSRRTINAQRQHRRSSCNQLAATLLYF